jgi:glycosyltransferase involved in cell wall biosynthesis
MKKNNNKKGISIIVCCYNSSGRLHKTLAALAKQQFHSAILMEIIIVDNASTDNTSEIALAIWEELNTEITIRVVFEPLAGLGNARRKGIDIAEYSIILFCDDDNWLASNYVQGVFDIMQTDVLIAACGGMGIPVFETEEPFWFYQYAESFALGSQEINSEHGRIISLYGAGLAIQKHVIDELYSSGFQLILQGRTGTKLSSSDDTELTNAFVLMGYKLVYSDELKFFHYLPKERLTFEYLKKLFIAFGSDGPVRNLYYAYISKRFFYKHLKNWHIHFTLSLIRLVKYFIIPPKKYGRHIYVNWNIAYIKQLFSIRKTYPDINERISRIIEVKNFGILKNEVKKSILSFEIQDDHEIL